MDRSDRQKMGNHLRLMEGRGAFQPGRMARDRRGPRRHEPPDEWLDRAMKDLYIALKAEGGEGPYASRRIANAAHEITHPHRSFAKQMRDAQRGKVKADLVRRLAEIWMEYAERLIGKDSAA